jgi:hypothetical protein
MVLVGEEGFVMPIEFAKLALGSVALNGATHAARRHEGDFALGRGQKKRWSSPIARRLPSRRTRANSLTPRNLSLRGNPSGFIRNGQFSSSLRAAATQHIASGFRGHPAAEAVHGLSPTA